MQEQKKENMSLLSRPAILRYFNEGTVVIEPFQKENLGTTSYDVRLGRHYFRECHPKGGLTTYNPYSKKDIQRIWGKPQIAVSAQNWLEEQGIVRLAGISPADLIIWIAPGETILCHTEEFIGGRGGKITTMMKARSSMGRNFIEICKCAGWGDVGYTNRWTMEITNNSRYYQIPLVVGRRVAQIAFFEVEFIHEDYIKMGKYQDSSDIEEIKKTWSPEKMLPRLDKDREAIAAQQSD